MPVRDKLFEVVRERLAPHIDAPHSALQRPPIAHGHGMREGEACTESFFGITPGKGSTRPNAPSDSCPASLQDLGAAGREIYILNVNPCRLRAACFALRLLMSKAIMGRLAVLFLCDEMKWTSGATL